MAFSIKNPVADQLARELADQTGESLTEAVVNALRERLARERHRGSASAARLKRDIMKIGQRCAKLPVRDKRSPDEILGYDEHGLFS